MARDTIFVGSDIPLEYHWARFSNNSIDLYKNEHLTGYQDFYRIFLYDNLFEYEHLFIDYGQNSQTIATFVETSDNWLYRRDLPSICFLSLVEIMILLIIVNLVTSVFKKGRCLKWTFVKNSNLP